MAIRPYKDEIYHLFNDLAADGDLRTLRILCLCGVRAWDADTTTAAAKGGHLDALKWLYGNGCPCDMLSVVIVGAENGDLEIVKWASRLYSIVQNRAYGGRLGPDNWLPCASAAKGGHLEILKWLRGCDPPWAWDESTIAYAVAHDHYDIFEWAHVNGCPMTNLRWAYSEAAKNGNTKALKWLHDQFPWDPIACQAAAENGQLEALQWLRQEGCPWDKYVMVAAARMGYLGISKWAFENGCPGSTDDMWVVAAKGGYLNILKWLQTIPSQNSWNPRIFEAAAENGHLTILRWLRQEGCPWNERACSHAAKNGHLVVLQWLRDGSAGALCPWDQGACWRLAHHGNHQAVVDWIETQPAD